MPLKKIFLILILLLLCFFLMGQDVQNKRSTNVLVAYFSWGNNITRIPERVDTITQASAIAPGHTGKVAQYIAEFTGGDIFEIVVEPKYSSNYSECLDQAAEQLRKKERPELVKKVLNIDQYDIIFLGFPNWWHAIPMAIYSFVEEHDLSGKTIVPFVTHGGGGLERTIRDLKAILSEDCKILEPISIYERNVDRAKDDVGRWLRELNFLR